MNKAQILHQAAMDFYDIGRAARAKGKEDVFKEYLPIAYVLDKEAAYAVQSEMEDSLWKYCYARSAAWMAIECGLYEDARQLAQLGLTGNPPSYEKYELEKALLTANKKLGKIQDNTNISFQFIGTLAAINVDENKILIRENGKKEYKTILLPKNFDHYFIGIYIGRLVEIEVKEEKQTFVLKNIKLAA